MYCNRCGSEIKKEGRYCPQCGKSIGEFQQVGGSTDKGAKPVVGKGKSRKRIAILLSVCVLVSLVSGGIIYHRSASVRYLAMVQKENGKYGYINETGEEVIVAQYDMARSFSSNGLALVGEKIGENEEGEEIWTKKYINSQGEEVISLQYNFAESFSKNGLAQVGKDVGESKKYGFINNEGEEVIPTQYDWPIFFSDNGLAVATRTDEDGNLLSGYINEEGEEVIPLQYDVAYSFSSNGLALVRENVGEDNEGEKILKYGYINERGEEVIPLQYDVAGNFANNGLAYVGKNVGKDKDGDLIYKYGYINKQGEEVIPLQYDDAKVFSEEGFALVGWQVGKINIDGENISDEYIYERAIINEQGEKIIDALASECIMKTMSKEKGLFYVDEYDNDTVKIFDKLGQPITSEEFEYASDYGDNGTIAVRRKPREENASHTYEYIDENGTTVLELLDKYIYAGAFVKVE